MNDFGTQITFKQLLKRHQRIQIPMIQRDYAQGRETEKEVREEFLSVLHGALSLPPKHESLPLNLDFVYGSVEGKKDTRFLPLDGQQRLTTLFLLHWYLGWRDGCYDDFQDLFCPQGTSRFFYSVRPSSTEFFNELVGFCPDMPPGEVSSLKALITNQPWYFRYWRLDPTIQALLTMLESIHERYRDTEAFYARLMDEQHLAITFQLLDLENFGLSDDLYIKMNARGKPLTSFETFKARYEQELESQFGGETREIGDQSFPVVEYFSRRMDTRWADFFWSHRDKDTNLFDDAIMNLLRVVALVTRDAESEDYLKDISQLRKGSLKSSYALFSSNEWLDRSFSEALFMLLEAWSDEGADFATQLPDTTFFDEVALFKKMVSEPTSLEYTELVQFVGYVVFLREHSEGKLDSDAFQEWMRVIFNLSVNTSYERPADMRRSIVAIFKLVTYSGDILTHFANTEKPTVGFSVQQVSEEKLKAELILANDGWRPFITQAERHGYFKGQIEFLLDFCGAQDKWAGSENVEWDTAEHELLLDLFEIYLKKAKLMFDHRGLRKVDKFRWERALLSLGDYTLPSGGRNHSFLVNSSTEQASWKRLLRGTGEDVPEARKLLHQLWDRIKEDEPLVDQLDIIIDSAIGLDRWRKAIIETPAAIVYCGRRLFRWNSEDEIYLLKKSQMNGDHAELFTYCLFHNLFKGLASDGDLEPLILQDYISVYQTDIEPGIGLNWSNDGQTLHFDFECSSKQYIIFIDCDSLKPLPEVGDILCSKLSFKEKRGNLEKVISSNSVQTFLRELASVFDGISSGGSTDA